MLQGSLSVIIILKKFGTERIIPEELLYLVPYTNICRRVAINPKDLILWENVSSGLIIIINNAFAGLFVFRQNLLKFSCLIKIKHQNII